MKFYKEVVIDTAIYPEVPQFDFQFRASIVIIVREDKDDEDLFWAEDTICTNTDPDIIDGRLDPKDGPFTLDECDIRKISFRTGKQGKKIKVRVWARAKIA